MKIFYTVVKHSSGLALIFFIVTFILVVTDLENLSSVPIQSWGIKIALIISSFIINKWSTKKLAIGNLDDAE
jgi:uncharacterized protein YebE (UPF0316 family)